MSSTTCLKRSSGPRATKGPVRSVLWLATGAVVVTALVTSACGADNSSSGSTTAPTTTSSLPVDALRTSVKQAMSELKLPGAVVLVATPEDEWLEAFGSWTLDGSQPVTTDDSFRIGSITKTMTGTVILQLAQEGKLRLDDHVSRFYAGIPTGDAITIADLLDMHSGITSYTQLEVVNRAMDDERSRAWTPEELVTLGADQPVLFPPGQSYDYSNTNTVLLGMIASKITGKDISTLLAERIFTPLGLTHTVLPPITSAALARPSSPRVHVRHEREHDGIDGPTRRPTGCRRCRDARAQRLHGSESIVGGGRRRRQRHGAGPARVRRGAGRWAAARRSRSAAAA